MYLFDTSDFQDNTDYLTGLSIDDSGFTDNVSSVPVQDVTDKFVTNENLPKGDFRINYGEGIELDFDRPVDVVDYGQILSSLSNIFHPYSENSFPSALDDAINNAIIELFTNEF